VQGTVGGESKARLDDAKDPRRLSLSVCALTRGGSARLAVVLELLRPLAAEVVVALDDRAEGEAGRLGAVADEVVLFPHRDPGDSLIPWLHAQCRSDWILNLDDDEVPSLRLLEHLPELIAADVTHWWLPRRWLVGAGDVYLDEPPWVPDYQLRLYRNEPTLRFSDEFHRPVVVSGPSGFAGDPIWHLDCVLNPFERRRDKALAYERARRGMRVAGLAHNSGFYLPELRRGTRTAAVAEADLLVIRRVLSEAAPARGERAGCTRRASREEIERLWPGEPFDPGMWTGAVTRLEPLERLFAGAEHTVSVLVENRSSCTWRYGSDASPLIQVGTRWLDARNAVEPGIHTPLPRDLRPGQALVVPVHVRAPLQPGRYRLVIDLVHEHVRWFESPIEWTVEVVPRRRTAVVGRGEALERVLDQIHLQPELEPLILERGEALVSERYGHERAPGLGGYLLDGLDGPITPQRLATLSTRTVRLLRRARRLRAGKPSAPLPRGAEASLLVLAACERLQIGGVDWEAHAAPTRELWRLATTAAAARRLGLQVDVEPGALELEGGTLDRLLVRLIRGR
jgi:hypothetical protein